MTRRSCETCIFFHHYRGTDRARGECRFNPPVVRTDEYDESQQVSGQFPQVRLSWWCSKFVKRG